jgi:high-affinity iron transporter
MLAAFLIMLREGVEAALIVGIVASYLQKTGRPDAMPMVWAGIFLALALSLFVGAALQLMSAELPQKMQELFEAVVGLVAVTVLTSMVFWMRKAARSIKGELQASVDAALASRQGHGLALAGLVFFAVGREGLESVFFLLAVFQQSPDAGAPLGAMLGLVAAIAIGYGIYAGGVRLDLRRFFRWTGVFIIFVAAGILAGSVRSLHEAGFWNLLQAKAFDVSSILPVDSTPGALLSGVLGYQETATIGDALAYVLFLSVSLALFLLPAAPRQIGAATPRASLRQRV